MRDIPASRITEAVRRLFMRINYEIGADIEAAVAAAAKSEPSPIGQNVLCQLCENYRIAREDQIALCQDTGMAVLFIEWGQDAHITGGDFEDAVQSGVRAAYRDGFLRKSIVADPLFDRKNTGDNTPAVIHLHLVPGEDVRILALAKGFGSENMSAVRMLSPAQGVEGVRDFVIECAKNAGPNPCPPIIVGVGIGGDFESAALMAKRMTARPLSAHHPDPRYAQLEKEILDGINRLGIGPAGTGGRTTALAVHIASAPTHIAGLPVAVNICCHASRHGEITL